MTFLTAALLPWPDIARADVAPTPPHEHAFNFFLFALQLSFVSAGIVLLLLRLLRRATFRGVALEDAAVSTAVIRVGYGKILRAFLIAVTISFAVWVPLLFLISKSTEKREREIRFGHTSLDIIALALDSYFLDVGIYPPTLLDLVQSSAPGWKGPYLRKVELLKDPWENEYSYQIKDAGKDFELYIIGNDKKIISRGR